MVCKRLIVYVLLIIPFLSQAQDVNPNGYNIFYHANGKVSSEGNMVKGKPDGYWKTYYDNGLLKTEGNRKNAQLDSVWRFYDKNGKLSSEITYSGGKKNGVKRFYDVETGKKTYEEPYVNDIREGMAYYFSDSLIIREVPLKKGKEEGVSKEFDKDKRIITIVLYKGGFVSKEEKMNRFDANGLKQGVWKEFYPCKETCDDKVPLTQREYTYKDGKLNGYWKEYDAKGNVVSTEKYVMGVLQKNAKELLKMEVRNDFHANGKKKSSGTYKNGQPDGVTRFYNEEGKVNGSKIYKEGILISEGIYDERGFNQGKWKEYYLTGELRSEGEYLDGKKVGEWVYYHQNGKVEQRGRYDKTGKATGDWKWYFESGNVLRTEKYDRGKEDGIMIEYSDTGTVVAKGDYLEGEREGLWVVRDGDKTEEGVYKAGQKDGKWVIRFADGKKYFEGNFFDGNPNGKHTYYHENGRLNVEIEYVMGVRDGKWRTFDMEGNPILEVVYENGRETKVDGIKVIVPDEDQEKDNSAKPK